MSDGKTRRYMNEREWQWFEDGVKYERERVIQLLGAQCDCAFFDKYELPSKCHAHKNIALIKAEK